MASRFAFVTLISSDSYLPGALTLVASLRDVHSVPAVHPEVDFETVCLVTPETVDISCIRLLRRAFDVVVGVEIIEDEHKKGLELLGRPDLHTVLTKLHVFRLTQFSKIIFIDADVLPIRPMSHLFSLEHEFSAVPDVGWPDIFNSGMMVFSPGEEKFEELSKLLKANGTWDGGDQGLLNEWRGSDWNRLSFTYNTTPTAAYTYAPAYERFGSQISAIHFIGPNKPWKSIQYRAPGTKHSLPADAKLQQAYDYDSLVDRWYDVYDRHFRSLALKPASLFEVQRYDSVWNAEGTISFEVPSMHMQSVGGATFDLETLRRVAVEGFAQLNSLSVGRSGEGQYWSLPLEGRIDLMRPRKPEPTSEPSDTLQLPSFTFPGSSTSPRTTTLATPLPHELPPTPFRGALSLPPTPMYPDNSTPSHSHDQYHHGENGVLPEIRLQESSPNIDQESPPAKNINQFAAYPSDQLTVGVSKPPSRRRIHPPSPPLLQWDPATEPPPRTPAALSAFPQNTFFTNVWDQAPGKLHDATYQSASISTDPQPPFMSTPDWRASAFFNPPPASYIPERLLREGHYANVTGPTGQEHFGPSPDPNKVSPIFPWEEKARSKPGRVFPASDTPPPGTFLKYEKTPSPTVDDHQTSMYTPPMQQYTSPAQIGQPGSLNFTNAWDTVASIQNYASKLARPHHGTQPVPAAPFQTEEWKKHEQEKFSPWLAKEEENSMDGDDEDDESDAKEAGKHSRQRSRSGSGATTPQGHTHSYKGKKYRTRGVQATKETRSEAVQVSSASGRSHGSGSRSRMSVVTHNIPETRGLDDQWSASSPVNHRISSLGIPVGDSPGGFRSPRGMVSASSYSPPTVEYSPPRLSSPKPSLAGVAPRKRPSPRVSTVSSVGVHLQPSISSMKLPGLSRSASNDTVVSSVGPSSPTETYNIPIPHRKNSRVWDPARGIDIFKKDSEEVLSRFLKMGSFDDATHQHAGL